MTGRRYMMDIMNRIGPGPMHMEKTSIFIGQAMRGTMFSPSARLDLGLGGAGSAVSCTRA